MPERPHDFGPLLEPLLAAAPLNDLGPGHAMESMRGQLAALSSTKLGGSRRLLRADMADACLAGLWLRFDFLDESHSISQEIDNATGSFWHGIMHRREGDASNAKYWFRRVGAHPAFVPLAAASAALAKESPAAGRWNLGGEWDPFAFVDLCQAAQAGDDALQNLCMHVQRAEWERLFTYCYQHAFGE